MLALAPFFLTLAMTPIGPTVRSANFTEAIQWELAAASPRIVTTGVQQDTATGATIGQRDGIAYVLTAEHGVPGTDERELHYFTKESYPVPARKIAGAVVALRLSDPDIALLKVPVGNEILPVVKLAAPGARPKKYPVPVLSIGCDDTRAPFCITDTIRAKKLVRRPLGKIAFFWETDTPPNPGRSGGALIDASGRVIGICSATQDGHGYFTHLDEILAGLKRNGFGWLAND